MNFYKRYIGDYMRDTAHLEMMDDGAYNRLLDHYYATGAPLQADDVSLYRIARAFSKSEQAAVLRVSRAFFYVGEDRLLHNKRADEEINKHSKQVAINREIGRRGGRPPKTESVSEVKPNGFQNNNRMGFVNKTEPKPNRNPNHSQSTSNPPSHEDEVQGRSNTHARAAG